MLCYGDYFSDYVYPDNDTSRSSFCACDGWFGWTGPTCEELGPGTQLALFLQLVLMFMAGVFPLLTAATGVYQLLKRHRSRAPKLVVFSMLWQVVAGFGALGLQIVNVIIFTSPNEFVYDPQNNEYEGSWKGWYMNPAWTAFWQIFLLGTLEAAFSVSFLWVSVTRASDRRFKRKTAASERLKAHLLPIIVVLCMAVVGVVAIYFNAQHNYANAAYCNIAGLVLTILVYAVAYRGFSLQLHQSIKLERASRVQATGSAEVAGGAADGVKATSRLEAVLGEIRVLTVAVFVGGAVFTAGSVWYTQMTWTDGCVSLAFLVLLRVVGWSDGVP